MPAPAPEVALDDGAADGWVGETTGPHAVVDGDQPVATNGPVATDADDDDPFMAELRRAVHDREPLGPGPDEDPDAYDGDLSPSARFRLRRKR